MSMYGSSTVEGVKCRCGSQEPWKSIDSFFHGKKKEKLIEKGNPYVGSETEK